MSQTRAWIYFLILVFAFFGLLFSQTRKTTPQQPTQLDLAASRTKVPQHVLEKGEVLGACFAKGTKVLVKDYKEKNIEDIKVGDIVLTKESETSLKLVEAKVIKVLPKHPSQYLIVNGNLKVTEEHVIFASGEWVYAKDLRVGDYMLDENNRKIKIISIERSKEEVDVYNLEVERYRTLFADGFYVHNFKWSGSWFFYLKDSASKQIITDATAIMQTRSPYYSSCANGSWKFSFYTGPAYYIFCDLNDGQSDPSKASVSINKSGYENKTASISNDSMSTVYLTKDTQPPSAPTSLRTTKVERTSVTLAWNASTDNIGVTGYRVYHNGVWIFTTTATSFTNSSLKPGTKYKYYVKAYDAVGNISNASGTISVNTTEIISDVNLPSVFRAKGSKSTNLSKIANPKKVKNLTFDVVGKNRVVFNDVVNLSSSKSPSLFKSLDKYVTITNLGVVEVDTKSLTMLAKKKATVSMLNLPFVETPRILIDGKPDSGGVVSNVSYKSGTLTFDVKNFSKFEAVPRLQILEPTNGFNVQEPNITLRGKISDPQATVSAALNNKSLGDLKVATQSGQFSKAITLDEGKNTIIVTAQSLFGATLSATVSGEFIPKKLNAAWFISAAVVLIVAAFGGGAYYWYKKRKGKISQPEKPSQPKPSTSPE